MRIQPTLVVSDFEPYSTAVRLTSFKDWTLEEMAERLQVLDALTSPDLACRDTMRFLRARIRQEESSLSYQDQIKAIAQERGIETLVHFTFVENLDSILKYGVMPIVELRRQGLPHTKFDHSRADNEYDKTSFSVEFPNYYMLSRRLNQSIECIDDRRKSCEPLTPKKQRFCILGFNASLAWERRCRFFNGNAACNHVQKSNSDDESHLVFENFFASVVIYNSEEWFRQAELPSMFPTQSQAEIMIPGIVPIRYIKWVAFQDQQTKDEVLSTFDCPENISVTIKPQLFAGRCDWQSQYPTLNYGWGC